MKYTNETINAMVENNLLSEFYDSRDISGTCFTVIGGKTGAAVYTLKNENILENKDRYSPYREHISATEPLSGLAVKYSLIESGLLINLSVENDLVSQFGVFLDLNFMSRPGTPFIHQVVPASPYTSPDGKIMYCVFKRPDGRCLIVSALTPCDGWKIKYSPENFGHFMHGFSFLASFDQSYGGSGHKTISILLTPVSNMSEAYITIGTIFQLPYAVPVVSGSFGNPVRVRFSENTDQAELIDEENHSTSVPIHDQEQNLTLSKYGFTKVVPYANGKRGIPAILWNGLDMDMCRKNLATKVSPVFHCDRNLCEAGFWIWYQLIMLKEKDNPKAEKLVLENLDMIMGKKKPYIPKWTIVPEEVGSYPPYHIYQSERLQEQFVGVSILLQAYKCYYHPEYLDFAVNALDMLLDNYLYPDGSIRCGKDKDDYTTVTCPVITITDMALFFMETDPLKYKRYKDAAIRIADFVVERGFSFPTEAEKTSWTEVEEGSVSCSALTVLYVARHLESKKEYLDFGARVLKIHEAWRMDSPDARMFGSTLRWWETIWEGDGNGPGICAGHAWTIWRAEALFLLGILTGDSQSLIDSWNGFVTNYCKVDSDGNSRSSYCPDYICGGGSDEIRDTLLTKVLFDKIPRYRVVHSYPLLPDYSLSRYAWIRSEYTWNNCAALIEHNKAIISIHCSLEGNTIIAPSSIKTIYVSGHLSTLELISKATIVYLPI